MAIVVLPFVLLIFLIIASLVCVIIAFVLKSCGTFNKISMTSVNGLILLILAYCFHIYNLSNYGYLSVGEVDKVIDGTVTFEGYLSTFYYSLIFGGIGCIVGLGWYFVLRKLSIGSKFET